MKKLAIIFSVILLFGLFESCVTNKKTTYLQDIPDSEYTYMDASNNYYKVQPSDNLYIRVITPDPKWAAMFNTLPVSTPTMSVGEPSLDLISYSVRPDGMVEIPYLGPIQVAGKTLVEVQGILEEAIKDYVTDAAITVKLVNNYVSILGDVSQPGRYPIFKEQMNIFQALAMAGDLGDYSNRYNVKIVREMNDSTVIKSMDLTDKEILHSEFYYVMPNDIIYAEPMKGKFFKMNAFPYAVIISSLTTFILMLDYIRN